MWIIFLWLLVHDRSTVLTKFLFLFQNCAYFSVIHYEHCVHSLLTRFIVTLCHPAEVLTKRCLPSLGRSQVMHQLFEAGNCFSCYWMNHWAAEMFEM